MDRQTLSLIQQLMDKLSEEMEYGEDDLCERLGREKPKKIPVDVKVLKVEEEPEELELDEEPMVEESPDEVLKKRLLKLRSE